MEEEKAPWETDFATEAATPEEEVAPWDTPAEPALPPDERPATLPVPRPNMFASMDDDQAAAVYAAYLKHPDTIKNEDGTIIYNGQVVPAPEGNSGIAGFMADVGGFIGNLGTEEMARRRKETLGEDPDEPYFTQKVGRAIGGGIVNAGRSAIKGAVDLALWAQPESRFSKETKDEASQFVDDSLPQFNPEGGVEHFVDTGVGITAGFVIGNKALAALKAAKVGAAAIESISAKMPKVVNFLSKKLVESTAGGVGTGLVVDDNSDTLAVGENAIVPLLEGIDTTDMDKASAAVARRTNIIIDAALTAMPIEMAAGAGRAAAKFAYDTFGEPIQRAFSQDRQSVAIMEELMTAVGLAADAKDPNSPAALAAKDKVVQIMKTPAFQEMRIKLGKAGVDDVEFRRDTASTLEAGLAGDESESADAVRSVFREQRKRAEDDAATSKYQQTKIAGERPVKAAERVMTQSEEAFGGAEGVDTARRGIQDEALKEVDESRQVAAKAADDFDVAKGDLPNQLRQGPMGEKIAEAELKPVSAARQERNETAGELLDTERQISEGIDQTAQIKWNNLPEGLEADAADLTETLAAAADYISKPMRKKLEDAGFTFDPELADDMVIDFKKLQEIRTPLSKEITRRIRGAHEGVDELVAIRDSLKRQEEYASAAAKKKGIAGSKALDDTLDYERTVRGPERKSGLPGELRTIRRQKGIDKPALEDAERTALHKTLTSDQPATSSHFVKYITDYRPEKKDLITKYAFADASDKLMKQIKSGDGISSIDPTDIMSSLDQYRQVLNSNPKVFGKELKELDDFYDSVTRNKNNVKELEKIAKLHAEDFEQVKEDIFKIRLNDFFAENGDINPNGYEGLRQLYLNPKATGINAEGKLDKIIELAEKSGDPMVADGMRSAYMKLVRDSLFGNAPSAAGGRSLSAAKAADFLEGTGKSDLLNVGRKLFKGADQPIIEAIERVLKPALDVTVSGKSPAAKGVGGDLIKGAKEAIAAGVRLRYGPLTRQGTTINTVTGKLLDYFVKNKKAEAALDGIMADPSGFLEAFEKFEKSKVPYGEKARKAFKWLVQNNVYENGDWNEFKGEYKRLNSDSETEEALPE